MKKETRRRKKRKIFYPRPNWITLSLYKKFLKSRYGVVPSSISNKPGRTTTAKLQKLSSFIF